MGDFAGTARFQVVRTLGAGGMGVVYEAVDKETNARVALKTLKHASSDALYRLKNEFRSLQQLRHPNLIELGELVEEGGEWFFTMELVDGTDLLTHVRLDTVADDPVAASAPDTLIDPQAGPDPMGDTLEAPEGAAQLEAGPVFDEVKLRAALGQLADAMRALHEAGKVHRDLKPSNVLVTREGRVVVLDLGLVTDTDDWDSQQAHAVGTPAYMAPEQAACQATEPAADWYSVGVMLYQALTGELPYTGRPLEIMEAKQGDPPPPPSARTAAAPDDLSTLCMKLLAYRPADRADAKAVMGCVRCAEEESSKTLQAAFGSSHGAPFVGRTDELAVLHQAYADMRAGNAVTVATYGESGMGKTSLVRRFTQALRQDVPDLVLLNGRCYEREAIPYKAFDGTIDALSRFMCRLADDEARDLVPTNAAVLPRVFPVLGRVSAIARAPQTRATSIEEPFEVRKVGFGALRELFYRLSERHPLVLVLDDIQWADRDSALLLEDLLHPPQEPLLLLILIGRPEGRESPLLTQGTREAFRAARDTREIALDSLGLRDAEELADLLLIRDQLTAKWTPKQIALEAQGHPLFVDELVRHAGTGAASIKALRLDEAILARVARLDDEARQVVELVALADAPLSRETVRVASQIDPARFDNVVSLLCVACLARSRGSRDTDRVQPYHDRVRESIRKSLDDRTEREHHRRLAAALEQTAEGRERPELWVTHLEAAGKVRDAALCASDAARRASNALAFDQAVALTEIALRLDVETEEERRALHQRLAEALANAGRFAEAAPVFMKAAEGGDRETKLTCQREAAQKWLASGDIEKGMGAIKALLDDLGEQLPATPRRAVMSVLWRRVALRVRGLGFVERAGSDLAPAVLHRLDVYHALGTNFGMVDYIRGAHFQACRLQLALRAGEPVRVGLALAQEAIYLASQGGRSRVRARQLAARAGDAARAQNSSYLEGYSVLAEGCASYFGGRFRDAAELTHRAEEIWRHQTTGTAWEQSTARVWRSGSLRFRGDLVALREAYEEAVADAERRGDRYLETTLRRRCAVLLLGAADLDGAHASLKRAVWTPVGRSHHLQHYYELQADVELAIYDGRAEIARPKLAPRFDRLSGSLLTRIQMVRTEADWLHGRVALAAAARTGAVDQIRFAGKLARRLQREDVGYVQVWGMLLAAGVAACKRDPDTAIVGLRDSIAAATEHDLPLCAATARYYLGKLLEGDDRGPHKARDASSGPKEMSNDHSTEGSTLVTEAETWFTEQGVVSIPRFAAFIAPGFPT